MSLENNREYMYQNDSSVVESDLGLWMIVFLDVDWGDQIKKAEALLGEEKLPQSGLGFIDMIKIFTQLQMCQSQLTPLLDEVMSRKREDQGSILRAYFALQQQNLLYRNLVESSYQALSPRFYISRNHKIYRYDGGTDTVPAKEQLEGHIYMATDQLAALTVWEFEMLCANEIPLRRCAYCGRYFRPYSVVNCYCDRVVEGTNGKTCKQVGATSKHQQAVNQDAAKKALPEGV